LIETKNCAVMNMWTCSSSRTRYSCWWRRSKARVLR